MQSAITITQTKLSIKLTPTSLPLEVLRQDIEQSTLDQFRNANPEHLKKLRETIQQMLTSESCLIDDKPALDQMLKAINQLISNNIKSKL